jgi:hypothetical protein
VNEDLRQLYVQKCDNIINEIDYYLRDVDYNFDLIDILYYTDYGSGIFIDQAFKNIVNYSNNNIIDKEFLNLKNYKPYYKSIED